MTEFIFATICLFPFVLLISIFIYIGVKGMFYHEVEISEYNKNLFFIKIAKYTEAGYYPVSDYTIEYNEYRMIMRKKLRNPKDFIKGEKNEDLQE